MKFPGILFNMLKMPTASLTSRQIFKGFFIFSVLILLISYGLVAMYPTFKDTIAEELVGTPDLHIAEMDDADGNYELRWPADPNATRYVLIEDATADFPAPTEIYNGTGTSVELTNRGDATYSYALWEWTENGTLLAATVNTTDDTYYVSPYDEMLSNPAIMAFLGGEGALSLYTLKGFVSMEFMSWIPLMGVLYLSYLVAGAVAKDVEDRTLDPVLATPISRKRYFFEKYITYTLVSFFLMLAGFIGLYGGAIATGEPSHWAIPGVFAVFPLFLLVQSFSFLTSVFFNDPKRAMGVNFLFVMFSYIIHLGSSLSTSIGKVKGWSMFTYYDYNVILAREKIIAGDAALLILVSVVLTILALYIFNKKDIPA